MRLPRTLVFPFGYRVKVKLATKAKMMEVCGDAPDGLWLVEERTIYIRKRLPMARKRYILAHEMQHALNDFAHEMLDLGTMKP